MAFLDNIRKIYVAGASGMVGSAICKLIESNNFSKEKKIILKPTRNELDLTNQNDVENWFNKHQPDVVIIAAAKVGGIMANQSYPVQFLLENLKIQNNLIEASYKNGVKRLVFLGSSCIYPKFSKQPIKEEYLLTNSLEETNQWYAISKIAGLKLCDAYRSQYDFDAISLMPTNLFGPKDNYDSKNSHVMAALIRKFYEAKQNNLDKVVCWGSGNPLREFLYVEDFAEASLFCLNNWFPNAKNSPKDSKGNTLTWLNIGSDYEISIKELAEKIAKIIDYRGKIFWDETKPDGTPKKKLDNTNIYKLGWIPKTSLDSGIRKTINFFEEEFCCKFTT